MTKIFFIKQIEITFFTLEPPFFGAFCFYSRINRNFFEPE